MANLSELWQTAEYLLAEAKYKEAIATLEEIQSFSSQLRPEKLIELKKGLIEAYINSGQRERESDHALSFFD